MDDLVLRRAPALEREVEARELELDADHVGREHAQGLLEQLLPGLVPFEDDDRRGVHGGILSEPSSTVVGDQRSGPPSFAAES